MVQKPKKHKKKTKSIASRAKDEAQQVEAKMNDQQNEISNSVKANADVVEKNPPNNDTANKKSIPPDTISSIIKNNPKERMKNVSCIP